MPAPVLGFIGQAFGFIINATVAVFGPTAAVAILDIGAKLAALSFLSSVYRKFAGRPDFASEARGQTLTVRGTMEYQRIVLGETLVSGTVFYFNTAGENNQALHHGVVVAGHEINDITDMWLDDHEIPEAAIDWAGDGSVDSGDFRGLLSEDPVVFFEKNLGTSVQSASPRLSAAFADITSAHRGVGMANFVARCDYVESQTQVWSAGAPQNYRGLVQGALAYNPSSDDTQSFGTGPHRVNSVDTYEHTRCPALLWGWYMTNTVVGFGAEGCTPENINWGYVASASGVCSGVVFTPVGTQHRFQCNGVLHTGNTYRDNIDRILSSMNGTQSRRGSQYLLRAFSAESATIALDDNVLIDDIRIRMHPEQERMYNEVRGSFIDPARKWTAQRAPFAVSSEYEDRDGRKIPKDIDLPMTTDVYAAQRLEFGVLEMSDLQTTVVAPCNYNALRVDIGGTVSLSNSKMQWTDKLFRVMRYQFTDLGGVNLVLREDDTSAYTDVGTAEYSVPNSTGYTRASPGVPAVSSFWALTAANEIVLNVTRPPPRLYEAVEIYHNGVANVLSDAVLLFEGDRSQFNHKVDAPATQYYWARSRNFAGEYSNFLPNSNETDVVGYPSQQDTLTDYTFDKGSSIFDFWEPIIVNSDTFSLQTSEGINNSQAAFIASSNFTGDVEWIRPKTLHQVLDDQMVLRVHYRINSYAGSIFPNSGGIYVAALGWSVSPIPPRVPPAPPVNTGTFIVTDEAFIPFSTLAAVSSWGYVDTTLSTSQSWVEGYKLGTFAVGTWRSNANSGNSQIYFDNISYRYT